MALPRRYQLSLLSFYRGVSLALYRVRTTHASRLKLRRGVRITGVGLTYGTSPESPETVASPVPPRESQTNGAMLVARINAAGLGGWTIAVFTPRMGSSVSF